MPRVLGLVGYSKVHPGRKVACSWWEGCGEVVARWQAGVNSKYAAGDTGATHDEL